MELRKRILQKLAIGVVAILIAAGVTVVIKDMLAMSNPASVLPDIRVYYDIVNNPELQVPQKHAMRVSYRWRFSFLVRDGQVPPSEWENMEYAHIQPGTNMRFDFSYDCKDVQVSVARVAGGMPPGEEDFVPAIVTDEPLQRLPEEGEYFINSKNEFAAPLQPGLYIYKVEASWGVRGTVLYYFKIQVPDYTMGLEE